MIYLKYVNTQQGSDSVPRFSNGNTLPLTQAPFAMTAFAPQTCGGNPWWFHPNSRSIEGIRLTHQPSPWIGDYGTILITPQSDTIIDDYSEGWSGYKPENSVLMPNYMRVEFLRSRAMFELAPTQGCASARISFDTGLKKCISLFNIIGKADFEFDCEKGLIYGYTDGTTSDDSKNFKMYFVIKPKSDWADYGKCRKINAGEKNAAAHIAVKDDANMCEFDIAVSYISFEQALANMREINGRDFEIIKEECGSEWESYLSKIKIKTEDEKELKTFYSCMYRTGLFPHRAYEITDSGEKLHYSPYTGGVEPGVRYTDNGFWDTYRTVLPLFSLIMPELYSDILRSVLCDYKEGGWLPRWLSIGEVGCMPSTLIDSVIAQGIICGLAEGDTAEELLQAMLHHSKNASGKHIYGREGICEYNELGYVPCDKFGESVNLTLDYAYGDFCIAQAAKKLGHDDIYREYMKKSESYRNIFDSESGFMRPKASNGDFEPDFDPIKWGGGYTEACAWQTTFSVPHALDGLAECMGGKEQIIKKLDKLFEHKPVYRIGGYGKEIHEMTEMAADDLGLCAISNQPSFLLPYIYAYFGENEKCEYWVNKICKEYFDSGTDGFPGDEDNGSMAAWYILGTIGVYPVCPGNNSWLKIEPRVSFDLQV